MKPSEFYEKYWKIQKPDGTVVSPPKLSDKEKKYIDNISTLTDSIVDARDKEADVIVKAINR